MELTLGVAKLVRERKESMWTLSAKVEAQDKQFKAVLNAVENLNVSTIPELEIDWDEIDNLIGEVVDGGNDAQQGIESAQQEVESVEDQFNSATSEMEYAVGHADDLNDTISSLVVYLRDIKDKLDD